MKKIKITFFNPERQEKRAVKFTFCWDAINHCWDVSFWNVMLNRFFDVSKEKYYGNPMELVLAYKEREKRKGEFVTIKNFT